MFGNPVVMTAATLVWSPLLAHDPTLGLIVLFVALVFAAIYGPDKEACQVRRHLLSESRRKTKGNRTMSKVKRWRRASVTGHGVTLQTFSVFVTGLLPLVLMAAGCSGADRRVGMIAVYEVYDEKTSVAEKPDATGMQALTAAIERRLNPGHRKSGRVRPLDDGRIEVSVYRHLGIIIDGKLASAPRIMSKVSGRGQITGDFTRQEVQDIVDLLSAGSLPAAIRKVEQRMVDVAQQPSP